MSSNLDCSLPQRSDLAAIGPLTDFFSSPSESRTCSVQITSPKARSSPCILPDLKFVSADALPSPYQQLLNHDRNMTTTLASFHAVDIKLKVIAKRTCYSGSVSSSPIQSCSDSDSHICPLLSSSDPLNCFANERMEVVRRCIVLLANDSPVEAGFIRIHLHNLPPPEHSDIRELIRKGARPLGALLVEHRIAQVFNPSHFFQVLSTSDLDSLLELSRPSLLYGRCNTISRPDGAIIAEVVEILPPHDPHQQSVEEDSLNELTHPMDSVDEGTPFSDS